jgi:hypothetical protein
MPELQTLLDDAARTGALTVVLQIVLIFVATLTALRFASVTVKAALVRLFDRESPRAPRRTSAPSSSSAAARRSKALSTGRSG